MTMTREDVFQNLDKYRRADLALRHEDDSAVALESFREIMLHAIDNSVSLEMRAALIFGELEACGLMERAGQNFYIAMPEDFEPSEEESC